MTDEIRILADELDAELVRLSGAIEAFKPCNRKFIEDTADRLDEASSDFVSAVQSVLGNLTDTAAPEMLKKVQKIYDLTKALADTFSETDAGMAENIRTSAGGEKHGR